MDLNGTAKGAVTTREDWKRRVRKAGPRVVRAHIPELDDPESDPPECVLLFREMTASQKEGWRLRKIKDDEYFGDERDQARDRARYATWGDFLRGMNASLVAATVVTETGEPLWTEADVAEVQEARARAFERMYALAAWLNGMDLKAVPNWALEWAKELVPDPAKPPVAPRLAERQQEFLHSPLSDSSSALPPSAASPNPAT
jgi:hypothetical protein